MGGGGAQQLPAGLSPQLLTCLLPSTPLQVIRKNFLLVYELLDEVVDYGFPQVGASFTSSLLSNLPCIG